MFSAKSHLSCHHGAVSVPIIARGQQLHARQKFQRNTSLLRVRAERNNGESGEQKSGWSEIKKEADKFRAQMNSTVSKPPRVASDSFRAKKDSIRKQENQVLDFWSQEKFFLAAGGVLAVILILFILAVASDVQNF